MKEKVLPITLSIALVLSLAACGGDTSSGSSNPSDADQGSVSDTTTAKQPESPADLSGEWQQVNSNSDDSRQVLRILDGIIEVYWFTESDQTLALYWAGSFDAPTDSTEPYSWDSKNDKERTGTALLASGDDVKTFSYENGKLSYSVSVMGETTTVEAEKKNWGYEEMAETSSSGTGAMIGSGDLGDYHVEIKGAQLAEDYEGNPAIIVTYSWTNNSDDTTSAMVSTSEKAFQDGVQLDTAIIMDSDVYDSGNSMKDVRPGTTLDIQCAFLLTSETSVVEFEIAEWISFSDDMVTMDFDPSAL